MEDFRHLGLHKKLWGSHGELEASGFTYKAMQPLDTWSHRRLEPFESAPEAMQPLGSHVGLKFLGVHMKLRIRSLFCT